MLKTKMNMRTRILLTIAATATILAGCSNEETNEAIDNWNGEIRLSSGLAVQTRADASTGTQGDKIVSGQTVYVWANEAITATTAHIKAWALTADGSNGLSSNSSKFYPSNGNNLHFYAIHGNFGSTSFTDGTTELPSSLEHTVETTQYDTANSGTEMDGYLKSDLLYAVKKDVARSNSAVSLTFYHLLSKVRIVLKKGDGEPDLTGATVTIEGTKPKATFTLVTTDELSSSTTWSSIVTVKNSDDNTASPITIKTETIEDFNSVSSYGEGIIVPQTVSANTAFIKVKLATDKGGTTFTYNAPSGGLPFESGKMYTYSITVKSTGLTVTSSMQDWTSAGDASTGDATMDEPASGGVS
ncbi:MAG: fimbrillin family protein [Bacteroides sp.]|nr:fimbrillin family protein [Bacteroides sp.]